MENVTVASTAPGITAKPRRKRGQAGAQGSPLEDGQCGHTTASLEIKKQLSNGENVVVGTKRALSSPLVERASKVLKEDPLSAVQEDVAGDERVGSPVPMERPTKVSREESPAEAPPSYAGDARITVLEAKIAQQQAFIEYQSGIINSQAESIQKIGDINSSFASMVLDSDITITNQGEEIMQLQSRNEDLQNRVKDLEHEHKECDSVIEELQTEIDAPWRSWWP